jgi:uncharacterized protein YdaU (DUF1376 family)
MAEFPALPFFTDAYLGDTMHLSLEEHGAYLKLLMIAWRSGDCSLPDDDHRLATMLGITAFRWERLRAAIAPFWDIAEGRWTQKKLLKVRSHCEKISEKRREAAKGSSSPKPLNGHDTGPANAPANDEHLHSTRARNPNPDPEEEESNHDKPESHGAFQASPEPPLPPALPAVVEARPEPLPDAMAPVWKGLAAEGVPRSLIGQWARNYGNGTVVDAYQEYRAACMRGEKAEPKTYIIAVLNRMVGKRGDDRSIMGSSKRVMEMFNQEQERRRQVALEYLQVEGHS